MYVRDETRQRPNRPTMLGKSCGEPPPPVHPVPEISKGHKPGRIPHRVRGRYSRNTLSEGDGRNSPWLPFGDSPETDIYVALSNSRTDPAIDTGDAWGIVVESPRCENLFSNVPPTTDSVVQKWSNVCPCDARMYGLGGPYE